ncbi:MULTISPECIES: TonB C-terminal domain-containing protein [Bradyrhizobium]|uniref:TonB C-terminal domain-containing protein n=1 Tax=Bradyrhizobium TaxID=374 RepID=UPI0004097041|nr:MULTISPECIES: TonB C-terminal domain-containing protein [Bradyrhizobium]QOG18419.1 hypothetical protein FOM02_14825 [Bradyrhizobium sp. SEMIA]UFW48934.1 TonB C-terminal domain-containing protein [Bradyrhizobium arachidis]
MLAEARSRRRRILLLALALLALREPASLAQNAGQPGTDDDMPSPPAIGMPHADQPSRPPLDEPPPLNLGGPDNPARSGMLGTRWTAYARAVQAALETATRENARTRDKPFDVQCEMWIDSKGHVTRVQLARPSGDADIDAAFRNEILPRLTLPAPASDMPMPVKGHITARVPR